MRFFPTVVASLLGTLAALGVIFFLFMMMLAGLASSGEPAPTVRSNSVLVVPISGLVPEVTPENPFQIVLEGPRTTPLHELTQAIRHASTDDRIAALWLRTGGTANAWAALEELAAALSDFRSSGKPLVASSGANGYSEKDFFLATTADHVFTPPAASFELNGFVIVLQFLKQLFDKLDIEVEAIRAGNFKSAVEPFVQDHASSENRQQLAALLEAHSDVFVSAIASRRGLDRETLLSLIDEASVTSAEQALKVGLVDSLIVDDEVTEYLKRITQTEGRLRTIGVDDYSITSRNTGGSSGTVAVVNAFGTIVAGKSSPDAHPLFRGMNVGSSTLSNLLAKIRDDDSIDAVVIRINSPGGSATASDVIWHAVERTAEVKPVVASMGDLAASGGYYIAAAADTIVADRTSITGSIGVFSLLLDISGLMEDKIGLTYDAVKTGPYADMFSGLRSLSAHERILLEEGVDRTYDRFKRLVAEGRGMSLEEVETVAQGRVWSGSDALALGLVDLQGGLSDAIDVAAMMAGLEVDEFRVRTYPRPRGLFEQLTELIETTEAALGEYLPGQGASEWFVMHARLMHSIAEIHGRPQALIPQTISVE